MPSVQSDPADSIGRSESDGPSKRPRSSSPQTKQRTFLLEAVFGRWLRLTRYEAARTRAKICLGQIWSEDAIDAVGSSGNIVPLLKQSIKSGKPFLKEWVECVEYQFRGEDFEPEYEDPDDPDRTSPDERGYDLHSRVFSDELMPHLQEVLSKHGTKIVATDAQRTRFVFDCHQAHFFGTSWWRVGIAVLHLSIIVRGS